MCVIGAGRRARRGETAIQILAQYYPGLDVRAIDGTATRIGSETVISAAPPVKPAAQAPSVSGPVIIRGVTQPSDLQQTAVRAHQAMTQALGSPGLTVTIDVHDTVEGFRQATGKPWWASTAVNATAVDLAPLTLLAQRDGLETTLRSAIAQAIMASELAGRPEWVRVGGARYFARSVPLPAPDPKARLKCPADAELTLAISAAAQREAESRAEACFARQYAGTGNWRTVK
jgi:hypothetical protein